MKKRMTILFTSFTFCFPVYATTVEECSNQLYTYGSGVTKEEIAPDCYEVFKTDINSNALYSNTEQKKEIIGKLNGIYIKNLETNTEKLLSGDNSTLLDIKALTFSNVNNEIYVLESTTGEVKIFSSLLTGNIPPLRTIRTKQLHGAIDLAVYGDEVFVLNPIDNVILVYSREANYFAREGYQKLDILRTYEEQPIDAHSITIDKDILIIHHGENSTISIPLK